MERSWEGSNRWNEVERFLLGGTKLGVSTWWNEVGRAYWVEGSSESSAWWKAFGRVLLGGTKLGGFNR